MDFLDYPICEVDSSGADNLGGTSANRVTDVNADTVGLAPGVESRAIDVKNLPEHEHDLRPQKVPCSCNIRRQWYTSRC